MACAKTINFMDMGTVGNSNKAWHECNYYVQFEVMDMQWNFSRIMMSRLSYGRRKKKDKKIFFTLSTSLAKDLGHAGVFLELIEAETTI